MTLPLRAFHRNQAGFSGAEKALLICVLLAIIISVGKLVGGGATQASQDAARTLKTRQGGAAMGQVLQPIAAVNAVRDVKDPAGPPRALAEVAAPAPGAGQPPREGGGSNPVLDVSVYVGRTMTAEAALRQIYDRSARQISEEALRMVRSGQSTPEQAARWAVNARNQLKAALRDKGSPITKILAESRNVNKYGNKLGPSYDDLIRQGKTPEDIIGKAGRANTRVNSAATKLKIAGRVLIAIDVAVLTWDVVNAPEGERLRTAVTGTGELGGALGGGWLGAKGGAAAGALIGSFFPGPGTVIGGAIGGVIGGVGGAIAGGWAGRKVAEAGYDYVEGLTTPNLEPDMALIDEREQEFLRQRMRR